MVVGAAVLIAMLVSELPPPPLVEADTYSPPPLVSAPVTENVKTPPLRSPAPTEVQTPGAPQAGDSRAQRRPWVGVSLDAALPDGAGVNVMVRPWRWVELHGGVTHNAISPGFRGGLTLLPADRWFVPTLTLELGTHPPGDANGVLRTITGNDSLNISALENFGYDYQNALLGFTFGSRDRYTIFLRGGVTRVVGRTGSDEIVISSGGSGSGSGAVTLENPTLFLPAVKVGFALYFF